MGLTINRRDRDALYHGAMDEISAIGDLYIHLKNDQSADAKRLYRRTSSALRLLHDLCWDRDPTPDSFELTMPTRELRPLIERIYWSAVASLNSDRDELIEEARAHLTDATVVCPEMLARLADDTLTPGTVVSSTIDD